MSTPFLQKLDAIEELIKKANWEEAGNKLLALKNKKIPEIGLKRYAELARRASVPQYALSLLKPIIRGSGRARIIVTDDLRAEYAANLVRLGVCHEAESIFRTINFKNVPEAHQTCAHLHIKNWNYKEAIFHLQEYLKIPSLKEYDKAIAKLNLSLSHIYEENYQTASEYLNDILTLDKSVLTPLIRANALRSLGNIEYQQGNYELAVQFFKKAQLHIPPSKGIDRFLIEKWLGLCELHLENGSHNSRNTVLSLLNKATTIQHWESCRDIAFQLAVFDKDEATLQRLYFGTPFQSFRERILRKFPQLPIPSYYAWRLGDPQAKSNVPVFDIDQQNDIKAGQLVYRLIATLSKDFYRPYSSVDIFDQAFPDCAYSTKYSEQRVYQAIRRVRQWFEEKKVPLLLESSGLDYRLSASAPVDFIVRSIAKPLTQVEFRIQKLRQHFSEYFTVAEAAKVLDISPRTASDLLKENVSLGVIEVSGKASRTRYRFSSAIDYKMAG